MVRNSNGYKFPSGLSNEIEPSLRRKFRSEKVRFGFFDWFLVAVIILAIVCTVLHFTVETKIAEAQKLPDNEYYCQKVMFEGWQTTNAPREKVIDYCESLIK